MKTMVSAQCVSMGLAASMVQAGPVTLDAQRLYDGLEARKVTLTAGGEAVRLDARVFDFGRKREGVLTTDPIDLGPTQGLIRLPAHVRSVAVAVKADVPSGAAVALEARTGAHGLDLSGWSPWTKLDGLEATVPEPAGRYIQVRLTLSAANREALPSVVSLVLTPDLDPALRPKTSLTVKDHRVESIVRSPIVFHYERPDHPRMVQFRQENALDEVVAGATNEVEALIRLMDWTGACNNVRGTRRQRNEDGSYAWNIDKVFSLEGGKPNIYGHCMSYAEVLVTAAIAMGHVSARHYAVQGFRDATHEVVEVWAPSLGKWIYLDPSLTNYYYDKETGTPLDIVEIHDIVAKLFVPDGKDMHWWSNRRSKETRNRVKAVGGKNEAIGCRLGPSIYGAPMPADYDWGWRHGYLALGFLQMTPRNDFHSHPDKASKRFEHRPGYDGYPFWVDAKTPPTKGGRNWFTRRRDFYWTLDQASFNLVQSATEPTLQVELGHSMPFFKEYRLTVDGKTSVTTDPVYVWPLNKGMNRLEVVPVDAFGKVGQGSSVSVER